MVTKNEGWVEEHFNDPRMIAWQDVVAGLKIMGLDMPDDGRHVIRVEITAEHLVIERCRRGIMAGQDESDPYHDRGQALWSITKDILMKPRREE